MNEHQEFEQGWWGDCANTFTEEGKQLVYAYRMGLEPVANVGSWPCYDLAGKNVLDLGGGPVSMLLKAINLGPRCAVIDPCPYPDWVTERYKAHGVDHVRLPAENVVCVEGYDEVWLYNVLQHVEDPAAVISTAHAAAPLLRLFEWVETPPTLGHPHTLRVHNLNEWIGNGANGLVEMLNEGNCQGLAYSGAFELEPLALVPA